MIEAPLVPELKCDDYKASYNFYTEILEFKVLYVRENEGFAMFEHEGSQIMIDSLSVCSRFVDGVMEKPYGRGVSFQIRTSDVSKVYERIVGNDHPIFLEMEEKWYRVGNVEKGNKQFLVQDPDGYMLRFFEDLGER
ncbi:MAG: hypothetical protein CMH25_01145 [Micavibrio sp.]|nr:hypothetical protein [Micavibrio sp.]|tara:strand:- start:1133 stop:1543 length:411 start_codon:yes stop_codon:yes gene_type:complete